MAEPEDSSEDELALEARKKRTGLLGETWQFLRNNKKWWLWPVVLILVGVGLLVLLGSGAAAPFIYTLF